MQERGAAAPLTGRPAGASDDSRRGLVVAATALTVLLVDQLAKAWAVRHLARRDVHVVWTLRLHLVYNRGGAFSLGGDSPWFFVGAAVVILALLVVFGRRLVGLLMFVALGLVLGGALGNLADRLLRDTAGAVVDFVDLQWWPVFNVADAAIVCGALLLVLATRERRPSGRG